MLSFISTQFFVGFLCSHYYQYIWLFKYAKMQWKWCRRQYEKASWKYFSSFWMWLFGSMFSRQIYLSSTYDSSNKESLYQSVHNPHHLFFYKSIKNLSIVNQESIKSPSRVHQKSIKSPSRVHQESIKGPSRVHQK